jgi:Ca2+-binding RTX toxin-like protein
MDTRTVTAVTETAIPSTGVLYRDGDLIAASDLPCLDGTATEVVFATVYNTDLIVVVAEGFFDTVIVDFSEGPLAPGYTSELDFSEIEILIAGSPAFDGRAPLGAVSSPGVEELIFQGGDNGDWVVAGAGGTPVALGGAAALDTPFLNLNAFPGSAVPPLPTDADGDVFVEATADTPRYLRLRGGGGNDSISAAGGSGTGLGTTAGVEDALELLDLIGHAGDDTLEGGNGNDFFDGGPGNDVMDGGPNLTAFICTFDATDLGWNYGDIVSYLNGPGPIQLDLDPGGVHPGAVTGAQGNDAIQNMESVVGSPGDDTLDGDDEAQVMVGWLGNDTITGQGGDDCLGGQDGDDFVQGGQGDDVVHGGDGDDGVQGHHGHDDVAGGRGGDAHHGKRGNDTILADDDEYDTVNGGPGTDSADVDKAGDGSPVVDTVHLVEAIL